MVIYTKFPTCINLAYQILCLKFLHGNWRLRLTTNEKSQLIPKRIIFNFWHMFSTCMKWTGPALVVFYTKLLILTANQTSIIKGLFQNFDWTLKKSNMPLKKYVIKFEVSLPSPFSKIYKILAHHAKEWAELVFKLHRVSISSIWQNRLIGQVERTPIQKIEIIFNQ